MKKGFKLSYNAPVTLNFSLCCVFILLIDHYLTGGKIVPLLFAVPGNNSSPSPFDWTIPLSYLRLFTHVLGHADISHLLGNLSFILLLGPLMEERYGSLRLALMMALTALMTGLINAIFLTSSLTGASGIAFMLIILASLCTLSRHTLPFSFILVLAVYIARELLSPPANNVSTIAHVAGGLCGAIFGFIISPKQSKAKGFTESLGTEERQKRLKEIDGQSPRYKNQKKTSSVEDDTTLVGTIKL